MYLKDCVRLSAHVSSTTWPVPHRHKFSELEPVLSHSIQLINLLVPSFLLSHISHPWWPRRWAIKLSLPLLWCGKSAVTWWTVVTPSVFYQLCILYLVMGISETHLIDSVVWWNLVHPDVWCTNRSLHLGSNYERKLPECKKNMLQITIGRFKHVLQHIMFGLDL